jgi:hypothetical protein
MTTEQQNIINLFNSPDPVNMEIAEEIAISTGNGVWFSNWIDEQVRKIKVILKKYCNPKGHYNKGDLNLINLQILLTGVSIEPFYNFTEVLTNKFVTKNGYILLGLFISKHSSDHYYLKKELEEIGIKVTFKNNKDEITKRFKIDYSR